MSIKVFTAQEALASAQIDASRVLTIKAKKENKYHQGTRFFDAKWNIGQHTNKEGWFSVEDIPLTAGIAAPGTKETNPSAEFEGTRLQLTTKLSKAGKWGQFLNLLDPEWDSQVNRLAGEGVIDLDGKKIHALMQKSFSKKTKAKDAEGKSLAGRPLEDPTIRFKIDFKPFPAKYPHKFLVGVPKTQIFDYRTRTVNEKGQEQFKLATIIDDDGREVPVTADNVHKFVTSGSTLKKGRIMMNSVSESSSYVSLTPIITRAVIEPGAEEGFDDEDNVDMANEAVAAAFNVPDNTPTTPGSGSDETVTEAESTDKPNELTEDELDNLVNV
ncbi:Hypothetical protein PACV_266 [Pacmanvirus A23]|uniref:Hypothetical protein n=1 Tax=Pacmanvirus A23 TaxID=1932881 RepID=UPI000A094950|nr:Hypothetical protein B9W72_gp264 [Pacmanvirus A23]SIP85981.1 Hypothetical protein PACV_266 [Pacmanvirus A23]